MTLDEKGEKRVREAPTGSEGWIDPCRWYGVHEVNIASHAFLPTEGFKPGRMSSSQISVHTYGRYPLRCSQSDFPDVVIRNVHEPAVTDKD